MKSLNPIVLIRNVIEDGMKIAHYEDKFEFICMKNNRVPAVVKNDIKKENSSFLTGATANTLIFAFKLAGSETHEDKNVLDLAQLFNTNLFNKVPVYNVNDIVFVNKNNRSYYFVRLDIDNI